MKSKWLLKHFAKLPQGHASFVAKLASFEFLSKLFLSCDYHIATFVCTPRMAVSSWLPFKKREKKVHLKRNAPIVRALSQCKETGPEGTPSDQSLRPPASPPALWHAASDAP